MIVADRTAGLKGPRMETVHFQPGALFRGIHVAVTSKPASLSAVSRGSLAYMHVGFCPPGMPGKGMHLSQKGEPHVLWPRPMPTFCPTGCWVCTWALCL